MFVEFRFFRRLKTACPQPMRETIRGFSRYKETVESLPGLERLKVEDVAKYIFDSFRPGCIPARTRIRWEKLSENLTAG
jgi:hypothetical protein